MASLNARTAMPRRRTSPLLVVAAMGAPLITSCQDVVVLPAEVAAVRVVPDQARLSIGQTVTLTAELEDPQGRTVRGHPVEWITDDADIASVDAHGLVAGDRSGTTTIRARVGSSEGVATVRVLIPASVVLSNTSASFTMNSGGPPPPDQEIAITNGGEDDLTGLMASIRYDDSSSGWLSASLSSSTAPASLTISARTAPDLPAGEYQATVHVAAATLESEATLAVSLEVRPVPQRDPPPAPNLRVENVEAGEITIAWDPGGEAVTEFRVERRSTDDGFQELARVAADRTTFADRSVEPDTRYTYRVRACNESGCSDYSNNVQVATIPAAPTNLRAEIVQRHRVRLAWTNNSAVEPVFRVERADGSGQFSLLDTTRADATFYDDRSVVPQATYHYRVRACTDAGCSAPSNTVTDTVPD